LFQILAGQADLASCSLRVSTTTRPAAQSQLHSNDQGKVRPWWLRPRSCEDQKLRADGTRACSSSTMQQQAVLACNNALRLLAAALAAAAAAEALARSVQSTPPCPWPWPLRRLVTVQPSPFPWSWDCARCWPDVGCGDTQKESTGCHVGLRQASTWGYANMGHVSQRGFVRRACCYCLLLLVLLAAAAPGAVAARGYTHELQSTRVYRQPEATFSNGQAATSLVYATLGASLANPKRPESFRRTECSGRISYLSYLALLYFASQKWVTYPYLPKFD